jgi:hypothetical protein
VANRLCRLRSSMKSSMLFRITIMLPRSAMEAPMRLTTITTVGTALCRVILVYPSTVLRALQRASGCAAVCIYVGENTEAFTLKPMVFVVSIVTLKADGATRHHSTGGLRLSCSIV